ncbi:hypothetical protein AOLI_G00309540 [Acnodon oligacanthus]
MLLSPGFKGFGLVFLQIYYFITKLSSCFSSPPLHNTHSRVSLGAEPLSLCLHLGPRAAQKRFLCVVKRDAVLTNHSARYWATLTVYVSNHGPRVAALKCRPSGGRRGSSGLELRRSGAGLSRFLSERRGEAHTSLHSTGSLRS